MHWWHQLVKYYLDIGEKFKVNPIIFVGIHVVATPLFAISVAWLIYNKRANASLLFPALVAILIFNAANIYLVLFGKDIPWWVYGIIACSTIISGGIMFIKIKKKFTETM